MPLTLPPRLRCSGSWPTPELGGGRLAAEITDFSDVPVAACLDVNPLREEPPDDWIATGRVAVTWSGWEPGDETGVATWGPGAWRSFNAWCDRQASRLAQQGAPLWIRPHASHVLSDAQRCLVFVRAHEHGPLGLLLDPLSMLTPSMAKAAADHLERMFDALGGSPAARALWLAPDPVPESVPATLVAALVRRYWPADKPVVVGCAESAWRTSLLGELSLPDEPRSPV